MIDFQAKRLLILATHFAPAYKAGGIVRSLENFVISFEDKYQFSILTGNTNLDSSEVLSEIVHDSWVPFTIKSKVLYLSRSKRSFKKLQETIQSIQPTVLYINGIFSIYFTIFPLLIVKRSKCKPTIVIAPCGMLHKGNLAIKPFKKKIYLSLLKSIGVFKNIRWHATDLQEKEDILNMFGSKADVTVASVLPTVSNEPLQLIPKKGQPLKLITVSLITPNKGHLKVLKALKELQDEIEAEYHIYGSVRDAEFWKICQKEMESFNSSIKVIYHGFLNPSDVTSALRKCHFFILYTQGENFCLAAYESFTAGRPVILSDQTPWRRLQKQKAGWDLELNNFKLLTDTLKQAYNMDEATYYDYCIGAQEKAKRFIMESEFDKQYDELFN